MAQDSAPNIIPVVLAGGVGSRLWPVSRSFFPKQFQKLLGEHSFLQATLLRAAAITTAHRFWSATKSTVFWSPSSVAKSTSNGVSLFLNPKVAVARQQLRWRPGLRWHRIRTRCCWYCLRIIWSAILNCLHEAVQQAATGAQNWRPGDIWRYASTRGNRLRLYSDSGP